MNCINPFLKGGAAFGCGQCMPCRFNKRREWTNRILLEAAQHGDNAFVTLTLSDQALNHDRSELAPERLTRWLKRLRKSFAPRRFRYYAVGEYGDQFQRAHYHAALFGYPACYSVGLGCGCYSCKTVRDTWKDGHVKVQELGYETAQYLAAYVVKKWIGDFPFGVVRPFARMSLLPGIGGQSCSAIAAVVKRYGCLVPVSLMVGTQRYPLGRYLRRRIADEAFGKDASVAKERALRVASESEELQRLREIAFSNNVSLKWVIGELNAPHEARLLARQKLKARRSL